MILPPTFVHLLTSQQQQEKSIISDSESDSDDFDDFDLADKDPENRKDPLQELSRDVPEYTYCEVVGSVPGDCVLGCPSSLIDDTKKLTVFSFCNYVGIINEDQRLRMQAEWPLAGDEHGVSLVSRLV